MATLFALIHWSTPKVEPDSQVNKKQLFTLILSLSMFSNPGFTRRTIRHDYAFWRNVVLNARTISLDFTPRRDNLADLKATLSHCFLGAYVDTRCICRFGLHSPHIYATASKKLFWKSQPRFRKYRLGPDLWLNNDCVLTTRGSFHGDLIGLLL